MKKLYAFIQVILNMLSSANHEVLKLRTEVRNLKDKCNKLKKNLNEWKVAFDERTDWAMNLYRSKEAELNRAINIIKLLAPDISKEAEETLWIQKMAEKYNCNDEEYAPFIGKPCVLRLIPGLNDDNPVVTVFDSEEDATTFWKTDDEMENTYEFGAGYNHLHIDGKIKVEYFESVTIRHWSHNDLQNYIDKFYADWCLQNNWLKTDEEAELFVCGDDIFDDDDEPAWDYCPLYTDYNECSENGNCPHTGCPLHE